MGDFLTVGQPAATAVVRAMLVGSPPHALLFVGPGSTGKTTLALDLAAGLLCTGAAGGERPCRVCRACRMVEHGNHPDLHRLAPEGAGDQIGIGGNRDRPPGVRELISGLALLPVEGVARVAIVERAHRMNEDAQSALLKTLEEPAAATTLILCADDDERLLPTVRSRCARVRFGAVGTRDIEQLLERHDLADAPDAARLARVAGGRPGLALAYAAAPGASAIRSELVRTLLDLLTATRAERLGATRDLLARSGELAASLATARASTAGATVAPEPLRARRGRTRGAGGGAGTPVGPATGEVASDAGEAAPEPGADDAATPARASAAERRRALAMLLDLWREVARDLAVAAVGADRSARDPALLDEVRAAAASMGAGEAAAALGRLVRASELLESNVAPELVLDVLVLRWPRRSAA